ncbi:hypothetical protein [Echinicola shivajiensis]|uniref:hypothetical protein n=1 Tax=Echinicola shivajiensis TaxID=1035916 RepID=UPI001BFC9962|nr:hypothetical protein [Echinicola shivajiensis]
MKKILLALFVASAMIFQGCEGPEGPQGPPGVDGGLIVGEAFEVVIDFNDENAFAELFEFTEPLVDGDALLVYMEEASPVYEDSFAWRLLPQTFYFNEGILVYNFDYTPVDFSIFMDGAIDFTQLDPYWTDGLTFRGVIIPADLVDARMDFSDYEATMKHFGITEEDFKKK